MNGKKVTQEDIEKMTLLRQMGHSFLEIKKATGRGAGTVFKYTRKVAVLP